MTWCLGCVEVHGRVDGEDGEGAGGEGGAFGDVGGWEEEEEEEGVGWCWGGEGGGQGERGEIVGVGKGRGSVCCMDRGLGMHSDGVPCFPKVLPEICERNEMGNAIRPA